MKSKFIHLEVGRSFRFEGECYVKSSPLMARNETNGQSRMIPRSAMVELATGEAPPVVVRQSRPIDSQEVQRAMVKFHERCNVALQSLADGVEPDTLLQLRSEIEAAKREFETALQLND